MLTNSQLRKQTPIFSGVMAYFPDALEQVAAVSYAGNEKHNPGEPLNWNRSKSTDEYDACARHLNDRAQGVVFDEELSKLANREIRTMACVAWRALAALQKEIEANRSPPTPAPGAVIWTEQEIASYREQLCKRAY